MIFEDKIKTKNLIFTLFVAFIIISCILLNFALPTAFAYNGEDYFNSHAWHIGPKGLNLNSLYTDIDALTGIDVTKTKSDVVVAVIDSGLDKTNPFFGSNFLWANSAELNGKPNVDDDHNGFVDDINGVNIVNNNGNFADCMNNDKNIGSKDWHGTHVSGIVHTIAPNCKIMPIRAGSPGTKGASFNPDDTISAILYAADNGADIINMSFGSNAQAYNNTKYFVQHNNADELFSVQSAINYAKDRGVLVVAAAGNSGMYTTFYPASCQNVISVMGSNNRGELWNGSNYGVFDIAAPSVNILSAVGNGVSGVNNSNVLGLQEKNGTSMASPIVAGYGALLYSVTKNDTNVKTAADLLPYITDKTKLSKINSNKKLTDENVLLDYKAAKNILLSVLDESKVTDEDGIIVQTITKFDNEKIVLEPSKYYSGRIAWYKNNELVAQNSKYIFYPTENSIVELKVDGVTVEKYIINSKSYDKYLMTIIGSVIGAVAGVSLIVVLIVLFIKKKKLKN